MDGLHKSIEVLGGQSALAESIGLSPQVVNNWTRRLNVPIEHCPSIERATGGKVTCEELRPDVQWVRVKDKAWPRPNGRPLVDHAIKLGAGGTAQKEAA
jgi:DNA-binding transcriptional regulator YdaS (Cro superfamily)